MKSQTAAETIAQVIEWRPVLSDVLKAFEPVLTAQEELITPLTKALKAAGFTLPAVEAERTAAGASLLAGVNLAPLEDALQQSAKTILPLLTAMQNIAEHGKALTGFFTAKGNTVKYAEAMLSGNAKSATALAASHNLEPALLDFAANFVIAPVLRAAVIQSTGGKEKAAWDEGSLWQHGYCPVCGTPPTISWLNKPELDEKNAYLAGGGGKKHLHCGLCGADWQFKRGSCPACNEEGNGVIETLRESGVAHGERIDWCTKCKTYCPTVDLREREFIPNLDALAMGMIHLDMVAERKQLRPLKHSFWNTF
ncbi:formate dehydrogenase accessory protein FdhE [Desulfovibrio sp. OttesenSCG-928-F07]|nr:formate dehydrogenase accessory protein FdhE [Desulfovibrio sp. OttesenSCG-928-F07]